MSPVLQTIGDTERTEHMKVVEFHYNHASYHRYVTFFLIWAHQAPDELSMLRVTSCNILSNSMFKPRYWPSLVIDLTRMTGKNPTISKHEASYVAVSCLDFEDKNLNA